MIGDEKHTNSAKQSSLCCDCTKLDCTWMQNLEPVAGWEAIRTDVGHPTPQGYKPLPSYCVVSCPYYTKAE